MGSVMSGQVAGMLHEIRPVRRDFPMICMSSGIARAKATARRMERRRMKLGFLYAGQGSQHAGMGADLYEALSRFPGCLRPCAEVDFDLKKVTFEDPDGIIEPDPLHPALHGGLCRRYDGGAAGEGHHPRCGGGPLPG